VTDLSQTIAAASAQDEGAAGADPSFPRLHGRPPTGWVNDPNGVSRIDGTWHVYFQHNPHGPTHADIHWGHASSTDLLRWRDEPIALAPRPGGPDEIGCWSGCLVDDDGVPTAVYTAVDGERRPSTVLARSDREARVFTRDEPPVAGLPADTAITDLRDPFLLTVDGKRFAVQGAGTPGGVGSVIVYRVGDADLTDWREVGTLLRSDDPALDADAAADIWECPSLVQVGEQWVLIVSIWRRVDGGSRDLNHVTWVLGDLSTDGDGLRFVPQASGRLDDGDAYYAPQALVVDDRVLVWGWSWETDHGSERLASAPWQGVLTYPRELTVRDGRVAMAPAAELVGLRSRELAAPDGDLPAAFEVVAAEGAVLGLELDGQTVLAERAVTRLYVDGSLVESFGVDGTTITTRAYPVAGSRWRLQGHARELSTATVHELGLD
jgi:beta-fructofuranosidase